MATWDDLAKGTWDELYTWDDPTRNIAIDSALASGEITVDAPLLTVDWLGDIPDDRLSPTPARAEFTGTLSGALSATTRGGYAWTLNDATAFAEGSSYGIFKPPLANAAYTAILADFAEADFDIAVKVRATTLLTGAKGVINLYARYQDAMNWLRCRLDFNTDQVLGFAFERSQGGSISSLGSGLLSAVYHDPARFVWFRAQGVGQDLRLKAWFDGQRPFYGWDAIATDTLYANTLGAIGWGGSLASGNTNMLPYDQFQVDTFWSGANGYLEAGQVSVGLSLDDGMPSTVTNTSNIGVNEASAELLAPIGISPDTYYSTFRSDQPFSDLDRDVAGVAMTARILASDGVRSVRVFTGRMEDIPTDDMNAKLLAVSGARLALSAPVQPPAVHGFYEGKEATWLIGYVMFKAGLYVAPKPVDGTRIYLPMNGTTHPYIPDGNSGAAPIGHISFSAVETGVYTTPGWSDGLFTAAPDLCLTSSAVRKLGIGPGGSIPFAPGLDFLSQANSRGRMEAWVRGDATDAAHSLHPSQGNLFQFRVRNLSASRYVALIVTADRMVQAQVADGVNSVFYPLSRLPVDGRWHLIAVNWDIKASGPFVRIYMDGQQLIWGAAPVSNANLPAVDDVTIGDLDSVLPCVELRAATGLLAGKAVFADQVLFEPSVITRRSILRLDAVAEAKPREGFEMLQSLAQAEMAQLGFDPMDRIQYLPLGYWAESSQQWARETLSTDANLGRRFKPSRDVRRIFNQVTLSYKQTYVDENWVTGFQSSQLVVVYPGESVDLVCALSTPAIELRGLNFSVLSGAALAATPPSTTNAINYITMNTAQDGSGAYATSSDIVVHVSEWDPGSATVRIQNNNPATLYLANNVSIPPLGIGVKAVRITDATASYTDAESVGARGIRNLPVSLPAIQSSANAATIATAMVGFLRKPRVTYEGDVWGDFRRMPGTMVQTNDADGTGLADIFRLTGISTVQDGSNVQQVISAVQAWPVMVWGSGVWGSTIWGGGV